MRALYDKVKEYFKEIKCNHSENSTSEKLTYDNLPHCDLQLPENALMKCAILILLFRYEKKFHVLLTIRSFKLKSFKGEICFPGGKFDSSVDKTLRDTALREAYEEIGLKEDNVEVVCELCPFISPAGHYIAPIIGLVKHEFLNDQFDVCEDTMNIVLSLKPNPDEVESIFWMPVNYVLDTSNPERLSMFKHPFKVNDATSKILSIVNLNKFPLFNQTSDFYDRLIVNFEPELFRNNVVSAYPFIYGINATLLLAVCLILKDGSSEKQPFEITLNGLKVRKDTLAEYLKFFRFCSYVMLKSAFEAKKSRKIKSNL